MRKVFIKYISMFLSICIFLSMFSLSTFALTLTHRDSEGNYKTLNDYLDTQGHWAQENISKWSEYGIITGYNGYFMPNDYIIRGDLSIIIDRLTSLTNMSYNYFVDLSNNDYFAEAMLKCVAEGYLNGVGNKQLNPRGNATREEVAVIFCRVFNIDTSYSGNTGFKDDVNISSWARSSVYALSKAGYLNGTPEGYVKPKDNITRAELITLLENFADTYISNIVGNGEISSSGNTFVSDFPKNLVLNKYITLINSSVGRDVYLTRKAGGITLQNSRVLGRIVCMAAANVNLDNSKVSKIILCNEKSNIMGVTEDVLEVYVCEKASESTLNNYPKKLVLEPGTRVKIASVMYENTTNRIKEYSSVDLKEDVSEEQGFVVAGPRISAGSTKLDYENNLIVENITITNGESDIREVGIVWIENDEEEELIIPTYKRNDGKKRFYGSTYGAFDFEVGEIEDYCTYRLYAKDKDGLYAYSTPFTLKAYDYDIKMTISEEDYPKSLRVDLVIEGDNIPQLNGVSVLYAENDLYTENLSSVSLSVYNELYSKEEIDYNKFVRYTGTVYSKGYYENGEYIYNVPTSFGYHIIFSVNSDNYFIREFPILSNVIPDGADLIDVLEAGEVSYSGDRINISNNKVRANLIGIDEVGIAYKISNSENMSSPEHNSSGWVRLAGGYNIDIKETYRFNTSITINTTEGNTFYVPYAKTKNGYFYGDVKKVENNWKGDFNSISINSAELSVIDDNNTLITLTMGDKTFSMGDYINIENVGKFYINTEDITILDNQLYILLKNIKSDIYDLNIRYVKSTGEKSNIYNLRYNNLLKDITLNRVNQSDGYFIYSLNSNRYGNASIQVLSASIVNSDKQVFVEKGKEIFIPSDIDLNNSSILISYIICPYDGGSVKIKYQFDTLFNLR